MCNNNKYKFRGTMFLSWILCFSLIFSIPVAVSAIVYRNAITSIRLQLKEVHRGELEQLRYIVDGQLQEMSRIALELSLNNDFRTLLSSKKITAADHYSLLLLQNRLKDYCFTNSSIKEVAIGFLTTDMVLTNKSIMSTENYFDICNDTELQEILCSRQYTNQYHILNGTNDNIAYALSSPLSRNSENNSFIIISLANEALDMINNSISEKAFVISTPDAKLQTGAVQTIESDFLQTYNLDSKINDITYEYFVSESENETALKQINIIMFVGLAMCFIFCGIILIFFFRNNYNPLIRLVMKLRGDEQNKGSFYNEWDYIENGVTKMLLKVDGLTQEAEKNKIAVQTFLILKLLTESLSEQDISSIKESNVINLNNEVFLVVAIRPLEYNNLFFQPEESDNLKLLQYIIQNVMDDFSSAQTQLYNITIGESFITLLSTTSDELKVLKQKLEDIPNIMESIFNVSINIGIGIEAKTISALSICYSQAIEMLDFCVVYNRRFSDYSIERNMGENQYISAVKTFELNRKFYNSIVYMDFSQTIDIFNELISIHCYALQDTKEAKLGMYSIMSVFRSAIYECKKIRPDLYINIESINQKLNNVISISKFENEIKNIISDIGQTALIFSKQEVEKFKDNVIKYIEENYAGYSLSVSSVAEYFNVNVSHLSKVFKKETGIGVLDYIHHVKIKHAKLLLRKNEYSIAQIATMVGYNDASSFIRTFKKYEGISPGKLVKQPQDLN